MWLRALRMTLLGSLEASSNRRDRERCPKRVILGPERPESAQKGSFRPFRVSRARRDLKVVKMSPFEPFWHKPQVYHTNLQD